jgi:hypothetical protein
VTLTLTRSEYKEQVAVFKWAAAHEYRWPCLALLFGSLMGTKLPPKYLNKAIKAGMRKGKPDINLPVTMGGYCGLWIELKKMGGGKPSKDQEKTLKMLAGAGNAVYVCRGSTAAIRVIEDYLKGKISRKKPWEEFDPTQHLLKENVGHPKQI